MIMASRSNTINNVHMARVRRNHFYCIYRQQCNSMCNSQQCFKWDVTPIIYHKQPINYAVMVLNTPITQRPRFFKDLWNNANVRATVDGGTNKLEAFVNSLSPESRDSMLLPHLITGDFDSILPDVLEKYKKTGCKVISTMDEDRTDFTKALVELNAHCTQSNINIEHVIAIAQSSRRMDQILGNIQTMFLAKEKKLLSADSKLYLISDDAVSWLLYPGDHLISIPEESRRHARAWCSLVPIGEPCRSVTSTGLKWNLDNHTLRFGEIVSTSNTFTESEVVKVTCSHTLLWSMRVPSLLS